MSESTPQEVADAASAAADEEMMAALERAGIDMNELARLSYDDQFVVERDDLDREMVFGSSLGCWPREGDMRHLWSWNIWASSHAEDRMRWADLGSGWEPDVASMVARVVAFLGMGKP